MDAEDHRLDLRRLLAAVEAAPPLDAVDVLGRELARMVDATSVALLIANFSGDGLVRLVHVSDPHEVRDGRNERVESLDLPGSVHERVLWSQELHVARAASGSEVLVPVTERGDAIGILELHLPYHPGDHVVEYLESAAHALAYVLIASRRHTDLFEWGQRTQPFSLAAEIQRRLLPTSLTCEAGQFTVAGAVEPAGDVGGDTFDYSLDRDTLHVSLTDAMGHEEEAALLASLLVASLRNSRRRGMTLTGQAAAASAALLAHARSDQFVTGQLLRVDLTAGTAAVVNAGHPVPLRLRDGRVTAVELAVDPPFGIVPGLHYRVQRLDLRPGDRLVFVTDGVLDRNAATADVHGLVAATGDLHPREVVQEINRAVLHAVEGTLRDDATVLCLDWYGGGERDRDADAGANHHGASAPLR